MHIANTDNAALLHELAGYLKAVGQPAFSQSQFNGLLKSLDFTKNAVKSFSELVEKIDLSFKNDQFFLTQTLRRDQDFPLNVLKILTPQLQNVRWDRNYLEELLNLFVSRLN